MFFGFVPRYPQGMTRETRCSGRVGEGASPCDLTYVRGVADL